MLDRALENEVEINEEMEELIENFIEDCYQKNCQIVDIYMQLAEENGTEISVCLVEKGSEIGAHILSGAVFEPTALNELFPDWDERGAPLENPVTEDLMYLMVNDVNRIKLPSFALPADAHNKGNYALSLGNLCRWLGEQAESLGVNIFPGFAASEILYDKDGAVRGIATGDMGIGPVSYTHLTLPTNREV